MAAALPGRGDVDGPLSVPARRTRSGAHWVPLDMGRRYGAHEAREAPAQPLRALALAAGFVEHYMGAAVVRIDGVLYG